MLSATEAELQRIAYALRPQSYLGCILRIPALPSLAGWMISDVLPLSLQGGLAYEVQLTNLHNHETHCEPWGFICRQIQTGTFHVEQTTALAVRST